MFRPDITGMKPDNNDDQAGLPILRPKVAGIDLASEVHWVCAPKVDGSGREVQKFGATTPELERMAEWLKQCNVESVAMESTGVYWIAPHEVLEGLGFEVLLVNTRELARVPGRKKTDRVDCIMRFQTLAPVDPTAAQLRAADRFVPAAATGMHAAHAGAGQKDLCSRCGGLDAANAEMGFQLLPQEPGSDECAGAPGGIEDRRHDRHGDHARHCCRRTGSSEVG